MSKVYPGMKSNYWVYVNAGADMTKGAPLMVRQDGETIVGNQDLLRLRLQIVSDNLVAKKMIPPMVHLLIQPGSGGEGAGTRMRSILYDTVSDRYGKYLAEEILPDMEKTYKVRHDAYSRAIAGASSGAICGAGAAASNGTDGRCRSRTSKPRRCTIPRLRPGRPRTTCDPICCGPLRRCRRISSRSRPTCSSAPWPGSPADENCPGPP